MRAILSLIAAFSGYSIHSIAQAGQKIGLATAGKRRVRGLSIWILSTLSMPVAISLILYAVSIGNASLVGAMSGSGLASLAVFSHLYMRERITKRELTGVFIIVAAAILIGRKTFPHSSVHLPSCDLRNVSVILVVVKKTQQNRRNRHRRICRSHGWVCAPVSKSLGKLDRPGPTVAALPVQNRDGLHLLVAQGRQPSIQSLGPRLDLDLPCIDGGDAVRLPEGKGHTTDSRFCG